MQNLSSWQVIFIFSLGIMNSIVIGFFDKGQLKESIIAICRALFQLILLGLVLEKLFTLDSVLSKLLALIFICAMGALTLNKRLKGGRKQFIILINILLLSNVPAIIFGYLLLDGGSFGNPSFFIPFCGMLIGNAINGLHLGISNFFENIKQEKSQIEFKILLGATGFHAFRDSIRVAMKNGLIPIINTMLIVGIVSIPGLMTGQMLAGASPLISARYQFFLLVTIQTTIIAGLSSYFLLQVILLRENSYVRELLNAKNIRA